MIYTLRLNKILPFQMAPILSKLGITGNSHSVEKRFMTHQEDTFLTIRMARETHLTTHLNTGLLRMDMTRLNRAIGLNAVLVFSGDNDIDIKCDRKDIDKFKLINSLTKAILTGLDFNIPIFLMPITRRTSCTHTSRGVFESDCRFVESETTANIRTLNLNYDPFIPQNDIRLRLADGVHFTPETYARISINTYDHIKKQLDHMTTFKLPLRNTQTPLLLNPDITLQPPRMDPPSPTASPPPSPTSSTQDLLEEDQAAALPPQKRHRHDNEIEDTRLRVADMSLYRRCQWSRGGKALRIARESEEAWENSLHRHAIYDTTDTDYTTHDMPTLDKPEDDNQNDCFEEDYKEHSDYVDDKNKARGRQ